MKNTTPSIIREIIARVGQNQHRFAVTPDEVAQAVQLASARWLAGYRASRGLYVGQLVEQTGMRPQQLLWLDLGLAVPDMLSEEQEALFRAALFGDQAVDRHTLGEIMDLALGRERPPDPTMLAWLLEDLELNVWRQGDVESVFAEYFSPADVLEVDTVRKTLTAVHLLLLQILFLGPKSSQELNDEAVRRRVWGQAGFDSATYAAVVDFLVTRGLIELLEDRWDAQVDRNLVQLQLTTLGLRVVALQRYSLEARSGTQHPFEALAAWLQERLNPGFDMAS